MNQDAYIQLLCQLIAQSETTPAVIARVTRFSPVDWDNWLLLASQHNLTPIVYDRLKQFETQLVLPAYALVKMEQVYLVTAVRNTLLLHKAKIILSAIKKAELPVIGLKGLYLLDNIFSNIALRGMVDLDFLIKRKDIPAVQGHLRTLGFRSSTYFNHEDHNIDAKHAPPMIGPKGYYVELHWSIVEGGWPFNVDENGLWQRAVPARMAGVDALALSVEDLLLHLCIHFTYQHRLRNGLRGLFDFIVILNAHQWDIDWEMLYQRAQEWRVERIVALTFTLLADLFGENIPRHGLAHLKSEVISPALLAAAKAQIFPAAQETQTAITPDLARLSSTSGIINKLKLVLQRICIPRSVMARLYNVPPTSIKIYWFYPVRFTHLFVTYARTAWQILSKRRAINPSLGYEKANQELRNWMEGR